MYAGVGGLHRSTVEKSVKDDVLVLGGCGELLSMFGKDGGCCPRPLQALSVLEGSEMQVAGKRISRVRSEAVECGIGGGRVVCKTMGGGFEA